jgi:hypothetical protein
MKYEKPEIVILASAMDAIHSCSEKGEGPSDHCGGIEPTNGAYEADE